MARLGQYLPWVAGAGVLGAAALLSGGGGGSGAPCGIHGPIAPKAVRDAILDAWEARGYVRSEADKAVTSESGWHAMALNCQHGRPVAAGMLQMIDSVLRAYHYTHGPAMFATLTAEEQMPYCLKLVRNLPRGQVPGDTRLVLFWPAAVGKPDDYLIASPTHNANVYDQNPGFRTKEKTITAGSVRATVA